MPFIDVLGSLGEESYMVGTDKSNTPVSGDVSIQISSSTFERIELSGKLRFFTT